MSRPTLSTLLLLGLTACTTTVPSDSDTEVDPDTGLTLPLQGEFFVDVEELSGSFSTPLFTTVFIDNIWSPVLLDTEGKPRWWAEQEHSGLTTLRVRPVPGGIWMNRFDTTPEDDTFGLAHLQHLDYDGNLIEHVEAPNSHHDFWVHEDGRLVWIAFELLETSDGEDFYGEQLVERSTDGTTRVLFSSAEQLPELVQTLQDARQTDAWGNHLYFDGEHYWLSFHNLSLVLVIDTEGNLVTTIGPRGQVVPEPPFAFQHGGQPTEAGILLHDNEGGERVRVSEYSIDGARAELLWTHEPDDPWVSDVLGHALRLSTGGTAISWGLFSTVEELDESGEVRGHTALDPSSAVGFLTEAPPLAE